MTEFKSRCEVCDDTGFVADKFGENETGMVCDALPSCVAARLDAQIAEDGSVAEPFPHGMSSMDEGDR